MSDSEAPGRGLRICIANKVPGDADAAGGGHSQGVTAVRHVRYYLPGEVAGTETVPR